MKKHITRRDFLKISGAIPLSLTTSQVLHHFNGLQQSQGEQKNVLVIVFDAFSAYHLSINGYQRETMPNLARLLERAVVYHNHYAGCNFTTPGTASLLTGTLPWTHRAFRPKATVAEPFVTRNIFSAFQEYYRIAYTHNGWANILLEQFRDSLDELVPWKMLFLQSYAGFFQNLFQADSDTASLSWTRNMNIKQEGYAYSLFFSHVYQMLQEHKLSELEKIFPRGIPSTGFADSEFTLEQAVDWIDNRLTAIPQPFLGYFHLLPPHGPYNTPLEFYNQFSHDGYNSMVKPEDVFTKSVPENELIQKRTEYDEFLLYVDREFSRLFDRLESSGLLENTWVIFTSDHGELFERGILGHSTNALYEPVIRIPLVIFEPGRSARLDVHNPTSAVDMLPTLLHVNGKNVPDWTEGTILPPYANADPGRPIFVVRANKNHPNAPITRASVSLVRERYKLLYFFGYTERDLNEKIVLYDIEADPQELVDLSSLHPEIVARMLAEIKNKLAEVDKPYL